MEQNDFLAFGEVLKKYRKTKKLTQRQLAGKLGVHFNTIWRWENGDYLPDTKGIVLELARQLDLEDGETRQLLESSLTALSSRWHVPYQRNPFFTGREMLLLQMHDLLYSSSDSEQVRAVALSGLGGVGKTQTAIEYAYRHAQEYTSLFWLNAATSEQMRSDLIAIADLLNLPKQHNQNEILATIHRWLTGHRGWLLIIDNVQDIQVVKELLPVVRSGSLLFTTQLSTLGTLAQVLNVEPMSQEEARHFLLHRTNHFRPPSPESIGATDQNVAIEQLVLQMGGLPLALDQAGAYIEKAQCSFTDFLELFQNYPIHLLYERAAYEEHPTSIARTFLLSFHQLSQSNLAAVDLLALCCMLPLENIPEELFIEASTYLDSRLSSLESDVLLYYQTLQELLSYSFIHRLPEIKSLSVHRLVRLVIREHLEMKEQRRYATYLLQAANSLFPQWRDGRSLDLELSHWPRCQRLLPLVFACEQLIEQYHLYIPEAIHLLTRAGYFLQLQWRYTEAEILCSKAIKLSETLRGGDHIDTAVLLNVLELISFAFGRYEESQAYYQRALSIYEHAKGAQHPETIRILHNLAELYRVQGKYEEAEPLFKRVLAFHEQNGKLDERVLIACLGNMGRLYYARKHFEKADHFFERALAQSQQILKSVHIRVINTLNHLVMFSRDMEKYTQAEALQRRIHTIYEQELGAEHPYTAIALRDLGWLVFKQRRYSEAKALYQRALALQERFYPSDHVYFLSTFAYLGQLALAQGFYSEAEKSLKRALLIAERTLTPEHPRIAEVLDDLAEVYRAQHCYDEAKPFLKQALDIRTHVFGLEHVLTRTTFEKYKDLESPEP